MKYCGIIILGVFMSVLSISCSRNGSSSRDDLLIALVHERDSLQAANHTQKERLDKINSMVSTINSALDSIAAQENILFINPESEIQVSRNDAIRNLARYEQVLKKQRERIDNLQHELEQRSDSTKLNGMVAILQQQLDAKDKQIAHLKTELAKKDVDISRLRQEVLSQRTRIEEQSHTIFQLDRATKVQEAALTTQDEIINSGYVIVGTKKDLERKGVIKKKRLIPESTFDKTKFARVDIRKYRDVPFSAKKPRILTDMPQSSYSLTTDGNGNFTLHITNPADFWKISNYLIIQTD